MIDEIIKREWKYFTKVSNVGGRAKCQDDFDTFYKQRTAQFKAYDEMTLKCYLDDLKRYEDINFNPMMLKYAYMMKSSDPKSYQELESCLPKKDSMVLELIDTIVEFEVIMREEFDAQYPHIASLSRHAHSSDDQEDDVSFETYLRGELMTYSPKTLYHYGQMIVDMLNKGINMITLIQEETVRLYGYQSLDDAEEKYK
ncbi:MAG: DUF4125 family protein [Coprobacillus sp.]